MPKSQLRPPALNGLRSAHILSDATRQAHNIPDGVLTGEVAHWKDIEKLVSDYFKNVRVPTRKWSDLYNNVKRSLAKLKGSNSNVKIDLLLGRYASKVESYIADQDVTRSFQEAFRSSLLAHDLETSRDRALAQGRVTGNILSELGAQQLAREVSSMSETSEANSDVPEADQNDDILETDDPFAPIGQSPMASHITIVKGNSIYQLQTPSKNVASPNKPALQKEDIQQLTSIADICINSSTRKTCSRDLLQLSNSIIAKRKEYSSLHSLEVFDLALQCTSLQDRATIDAFLANLHPGVNADPVVSRFIKKAISEFALGSQRATPYTSDDERTIYIEVFVPLFRYFALMGKKLVFIWSEKAMKNTSSTWIIDTNYKKSGVNKKLLDGIGVMIEEDISWLLIESSGYGKEQNYTHSVEDCIKNLKNGTDSLKYIMSKYKNASISTMKKVKIYSVQIIQTNMSLVCYQLKNGQKWSCYECFAAEVPLLWSKRSLWLPVLEMFGFLHQELIEQEQVHAELLKESLGIANVEGDKISSLIDDAV